VEAEIELYSFTSASIGVGGIRHAPAALSPGKRSGTHYNPRIFQQNALYYNIKFLQLKN
jgi:hypothetical protein